MLPLRTYVDAAHNCRRVPRPHHKSLYVARKTDVPATAESPAMSPVVKLLK